MQSTFVQSDKGLQFYLNHLALDIIKVFYFTFLILVICISVLLTFIHLSKTCFFLGSGRLTLHCQFYSSFSPSYFCVSLFFSFSTTLSVYDSQSSKIMTGARFLPEELSSVALFFSRIAWYKVRQKSLSPCAQAFTPTSCRSICPENP